MDEERINQLKKFKKKGLIRVILACEDEIELLNLQLLENNTPIIMIEDLLNTKMTDYLKERIRVIQDPERRNIYLLELQRLNEEIKQ